MELDQILKNLAESPTASILDFGFGSGECLKELQKNGYSKLSGFDVVHSANLDLEFAEISVASDSILWLQSHESKFDVILAKESLYYISQLDQPVLWKSLFNSLKPSGKLVVLVFNGNLSTSSFIQAKDLDIKFAFNEYSLTNLAESSGFSGINAQPLNITYKNRFSKFQWEFIFFLGKMLNQIKYITERGLDPANPRILSKTIHFVAYRKPMVG